MSRVRPEGIDQFHERLAEFKRSNKASLSVRDVVAKSMRKIEEVRKYGATWDDVAQLLSESFQTEGHDGFQISGKTIQGYYSKILKERQKAKELSGYSDKQGKRVNPSNPTKSIDDVPINSGPFGDEPGDEESDRPEPESSQDTVADSNGFDPQQQTEDPALSGSSATKKSRFNFNTVRPETVRPEA